MQYLTIALLSVSDWTGRRKRLNEEMKALVKGLQCMADQMVIYLVNYLCINSYVFIEI